MAGSCVAADVDAAFPDGGAPDGGTDAGADAAPADAGPDAGCVPTGTEVCDGVDNDCNYMTDEGCPAAVALRAPWNGNMTGSVWATGASLTVKPRRPRFSWADATGATSYEVEVDDSCATPGFQSCAFASPEASTTTPATVFTPSADLPVAMSAPVGRRYYWRVRACAAIGCGPWSPVRYVDAGRMATDFNGDGYADVVAGAPAHDAGGAMDSGRAYMYQGAGGASLDGTFDATIAGVAAGDRLGTAVASAGDVNADGFADLIVGAPQNDFFATDAGRAQVFLGGASFDSATPDVNLYGEGGTDLFGTSVATAGDVNGDGFADVVVGGHQNDAGAANAGRAYVFLGGATMDAVADVRYTGVTAGELLGYSVSSAGDMNGDGYTDVIAGAYANDLGGPSAGQAYVFFGAAVPGDKTAMDADLTLAGTGNFGWSVDLAGDVNGDGFGDVLVGAPREDAIAIVGGRAHVFFGSTAPDATADWTLGTASEITMSDLLGRAVAGAGDVNGDGFADVVIGSPYFDLPGPISDAGKAAVYFGGAAAMLDTGVDGTLLGAAIADIFGAAVAVLDGWRAPDRAL